MKPTLERIIKSCKSRDDVYHSWNVMKVISLYLLFSKHNIDKIINVEYDTFNDVLDHFPIAVGWGIFSGMSDFCKEYKI